MYILRQLSDTEVVLIGLSIYGKDFIKKLRGQFSIAFYDSNIKKLMLIRDRLDKNHSFILKMKIGFV